MKTFVKLYFLFISISFFAQETIKIPDIGLEEALIDLNLDSNGLTGDILVSDAKYVVNLNVNNPIKNKKLPNVHSKIKDLTGIEHFPNLTRLDCYGNEIKKIDLSKNTKLSFLNCSYNKIETLDLTNNVKLLTVSCDNNKLTSLKIGNKPDLRDLYCNNNYLRSLDIKGCSALENFDASSNRINKIAINKEAYSVYSDGWYKDATVAFVENIDSNEVVVATTTEKNAETVNAPKVLETKQVAQNQSGASAENYYEKFQRSVITEYDKLVLAPNYLKSKQDILQQKYGLSASKLSEWISQYAALKTTSNKVNNIIVGAPEKQSPIYYSKFKQSAVDEYESLVLNQAYLQSKKQEIQKKYNLNAGEFTKWIAQLGSPALKIKKEQPKESAKSYFEKYKQSVVKEYENLVLNTTHIQTVKAQVQKKYNLTAAQLTKSIKKHSTVRTR